ncbi:MAG: ribonuclease Z [Phycisphaerales bacterium]|nr:ribonuclease Z [Phycisphaerales bacterium]
MDDIRITELNPLPTSRTNSILTTMSIRAVIIGTGSALSERSYGSSAAIVTEHGLILIDCPDAILRAMRDASKTSGIPLDAMRITDILVTHLHGDHVNGLETIGWKHWIARQTAPAAPPRIHTIEVVARRLWERLAPSMDQNGSAKLEDYFSVNVLEPGTTTLISDLAVEVRPTEHLIPCCGFRISRGGATLGWSGDTRFDPSHIDWLSTADVIVHETTESRVHTPIACLNALDPAVRAKMRLIHMDDAFDQTSTDIAVLTDGQVLDVSPSGR